MTDRYEKFMFEIEKGSIKILDSGVPTELKKRGCRMGKSYWSGAVFRQSVPRRQHLYVPGMTALLNLEKILSLQ